MQVYIYMYKKIFIYICIGLILVYVHRWFPVGWAGSPWVGQVAPGSRGLVTQINYCGFLWFLGR